MQSLADLSSANTRWKKRATRDKEVVSEECLDKMELEANTEVKISVVSCGSQTRSSKNLEMRRKLGREDRNSGRVVLQRIKMFVY